MWSPTGKHDSNSLGQGQLGRPPNPSPKALAIAVTVLQSLSLWDRLETEYTLKHGLTSGWDQSSAESLQAQQV